LFIIACLLVSWWHVYNSAKARDYIRIGDLKVIQGEMSRYFLKYNTYVVPGCQGGSLVNYCIGSQEKTAYLNNIVDPLSSQGFIYAVNNLSERDYSISFGLETSVGGLKPGSHILTKNGVAK